ncbi:MAG: hypothetical protein OCU22_07680 [Canidatus Methanoxibalbensis ujae]|nr:hypothetical protein [Candidatus Methanoxibalbensis ujae]
MAWLLVREWSGLCAYRVDRADKIGVVIKRATEEELSICLKIKFCDTEDCVEIGTVRDEEADITDEKQEFLMKYLLYYQDGVIEAEKLVSAFIKKK